MTRRRGLLPLALAATLWLGAEVIAQGEGDAAAPPTEEVTAPYRDLAAALDEIDDETERLPRGFGNDAAARAAFEALASDRTVRARELAEAMLAERPDSPEGHVLLGLVLHRGEGNLPRALYHLKRGRELLEARYGDPPGDDAPWFFHHTALTYLALVAGEMGDHETKLRYLDEREARYQPAFPAERGWPLMRLRRYREARAAAEAGLASADLEQRITAQTALCAIEAEQLRREASYQACKRAAEMERRQARWNSGPTPFTNAAESALGVLRLDEAETFILQGSEQFAYGAVSNPWLDLTMLYVAEGRTPEALDALREMFAWRRRQPPFVDEQNRAETDMASAVFLLAAGRAVEATRVTGRTLDRPDRTGFTSAESEQMQAAAAMLDHAANRVAAERFREQASWLPWLEAWGARWQAQRHGFRAWASGRRAAKLVTGERILLSTLRPYLAGSMELPEWIEPDLVEVLGPGVVLAALDQARRAETLAGAEAYFHVFAAESALAQSRYERAIALAGRALEELPRGEVLLAARVATVGARAAGEEGFAARSLALFDRALQLDPGVVRRTGAALPVRLAATDGEVPRRAARLLRRSPRFALAEEGFRLQVEGDDVAGGACLSGPGGAIVGCARVTARAGEDADAVARRLAHELHEELFAPRLDLTQADLRSLDGSPTVGGVRSAERLQTVIDDVVSRR